MIKEILTAAGISYPEGGRFLRLPEEMFADYFDDIDVDGADQVPLLSSAGMTRIYRHDVRVELYELLPDDAKVAAFEAELDARGLPWTKEDRYWLSDVQRYQTLYEFSYTEKRRI